jgi:hypothetical protein
MARLNIPGLSDPGYIEPIIAPELPGAVERALDAGAPAPLEYVGAGMFGIVFCDENNHAWKVARLSSRELPQQELDFMLETFANEYEWLRDAGQSSMAMHVAKAYKFHPDELTIERECVRGRAGGWVDDTRLHKIHDRIDKAMRIHGWTSPEFKEDSYIIKKDGTEVLVDASSAMRIGMNLAGWVQDVLDGRRRTRDNWKSLAFYVMSEIRHSEIPRDLGYQLIDRLNERDTEIKPGFGFKRTDLP